MQQTITDAQSEQLYLGRQPILDRDRNIVAFELLFRSSQHANSANHLCESRATITVINHAFNELGFETILGDCLGFINLDAALLTDEIIELLPKSKVVFEILETVSITEEVIARCRTLKSMGYQLALDDVVNLEEDHVEILQYIDIIKLDISQIDDDRLALLASQIKTYYPKVRLLAEKVETIDQFECCLALGCELFQGYFFAKPQIISGRRMSPSQLTILKLMDKLMSDANPAEIENILKENAALSINLLKITNSAASGSMRVISSIREAVTILGRRQLQRWVNLLLYVNSGQGRLSPLLLLAACRGKSMEMIAKEKNEGTLEDHAFITGIMSLIDTLLGIPIDEAISQIQLNKSIAEALLDRTGELGTILRLVELLEQNNEAGVSEIIPQLPYLTSHNLKHIHADSMLWANAVCQT